VEAAEADGCDDGGPWPCLEPGCPGDGTVGCSHLSEACAHRPEALWKTPPPQLGTEKLFIWELCPLSCGRCPAVQRDRAAHVDDALRELFDDFGERNLGSLALRTGAPAVVDALALFAEAYRWQLVGAAATPPRYTLVGDQAAWRTALFLSVPTGRLREHVLGAAEVCYGRVPNEKEGTAVPCALAHSGNAAERIRWVRAGLCDGAPEDWRRAPKEEDG